MAATSTEKTGTVVGKDELIHQIAARAGMNLKETSKVIDAFTDVVREDVAKGQEVRLMGFGTWNLRDVAPRKVKSILNFVCGGRLLQNIVSPSYRQAARSR